MIAKKANGIVPAYMKILRRGERNYKKARTTIIDVHTNLELKALWHCSLPQGRALLRVADLQNLNNLPCVQ